MCANAKNEISAIRGELSSIIRELEGISRGIRTEFSGIGNEQCANCIDRVIDKYYYVEKKLNNVNTNNLADWYADSHTQGGGGKGSFGCDSGGGR